MTIGFRTAQIACSLLVTALLAGCGVKNLPEAPDSNLAPSEAVQPELGGGADLIGGGESDADRVLTGARIASVGDEDDDDRISAAEVATNPGASRRSFFLDPLLN